MSTNDYTANEHKLRFFFQRIGTGKTDSDGTHPFLRFAEQSVGSWAQSAICDRALQALARGLAEIRSPVGECEPAPMSARAQVAIASAADSLALSHTALHSGAGHDAQSLAAITDAGMIFIPSRDGISHSPLELSEWDDCVNGANVLLRAALKIAEES